MICTTRKQLQCTGFFFYPEYDSNLSPKLITPSFVQAPMIKTVSLKSVYYFRRNCEHRQTDRHKNANPKIISWCGF